MNSFRNGAVRVLRAGSLLACCLLATSCAKQGGPDTFPVSGVVVMDGQPVEGASVSFEPVVSGPDSLSSQGVTDVDGRFSLQTHIGNNEFKDGLQAGEYAVVVTKLEVVADMRRRPKNLLPRKFSQARTSGLTAVVESGDNDFEFALD